MQTVILIYLGILTFAYVTFALSVVRMMQKFIKSMQSIVSDLSTLSKRVDTLLYADIYKIHQNEVSEDG